MLADCLHGLDALGVGGLATLAAALFLAGLAGGLTHCAGMCGPFVMAQVAARPDRLAGGRLQRLAGAALLSYHAGRVAGYTLLGGVVGGLAGLVSLASGLRWVLVAMLLAAALAMAAQASTRLAALLPHPPALRLPSGLLARLQPFGAPAGGWRSFALGLCLSALPCGLLYGALAGAAAAGSVLGGALAMLAFVLGTLPALVGVGLLGGFLARRAGPRLRALGGLLFAANAVVLAAMALRLAG
ncbi:sulfite exporter TauE/SafE family protein [Roseomonas sp. OT10]|uniref:sulfite exporter TauE/SafE family protein n=1 Tax=Roseomonas cutis TaxID=2897332 RepID=UPI001E347F02|nr:sulfite exporter TauE/SafE family protein [Roseomonas sp. OT10]UFN48626.1 sulfite exporter TauE/SafE family protein [Roseomonas sp. OT10]